MAKRSTQKFTYLENKKSFENKMKNIFHHFYRAFIEANKTFFLKRVSPTLKCCLHRIYAILIYMNKIFDFYFRNT